MCHIEYVSDPTVGYIINVTVEDCNIVSVENASTVSVKHIGQLTFILLLYSVRSIFVIYRVRFLPTSHFPSFVEMSYVVNTNFLSSCTKITIILIARTVRDAC